MILSHKSSVPSANSSREMCLEEQTDMMAGVFLFTKKVATTPAVALPHVDISSKDWAGTLAHSESLMTVVTSLLLLALQFLGPLPLTWFLLKQLFLPPITLSLTPHTLDHGSAHQK